MIRVKIMILSAVLCCYGSVAQTKYLDSLWVVYNNKTNADTIRLSAIHAIAWNYRSNNPDTAIILAEKELNFVSILSNGNKKKWTARALNTIGNSFMNKSNYPKSLECYLKSLKLSEEIKEKTDIGYCCNYIGLLYAFQSDYRKALEYDLRAIHIYEETKNKRGEGGCYVNMGNVYSMELNDTKALDSYLKALKILEEINDNVFIGNCYGSIGDIYHDKKDYPRALSYYFKAFKTIKEIGDKNGIGNIYLHLGASFLGASNYQLSILYSDSALVIAKEIGELDIERAAYQNLAIAYSKMGKYKEAYESHIKFKQLTDSIFNTENSNALSDLKINFEVDKKETELKAKEEAQKTITTEEKKRQQLVIFAVAGVLLLVIIFSLFLYKRFAITRKQNIIIEKQKFIVEQKNYLIEEKHKEITDSINYAERIQRSLLASKQLLDEKLKEYFVLFKPKDVVSGDFYWASKLSDNNFVLVTADSTGHGVPGAIMSMLNMNSLKEAVTKGLTKADDILNYTRTIIIDTLANDGSIDGGKDGMDCSLLIFDFNTLCLSWVAANNPVWIVRNAGHSNCELIELKPQKMPVGKHVKQHEPFITQTFQLQKNDLVFTITDGYPDQFGGVNGKKFMSKNLKELLLANANLPLQQQHEMLDQVFKNWIGDLEQVDDVTIIGIKI